jgi:hypothetical protein
MPSSEKVWRALLSISLSFGAIPASSGGRPGELLGAMPGAQALGVKCGDAALGAMPGAQAPRQALGGMRGDAALGAIPGAQAFANHSGSRPLERTQAARSLRRKVLRRLPPAAPLLASSFRSKFETVVRICLCCRAKHEDPNQLSSANSIVKPRCAVGQLRGGRQIVLPRRRRALSARTHEHCHTLEGACWIMMKGVCGGDLDPSASGLAASQQ